MHFIRNPDQLRQSQNLISSGIGTDVEKVLFASRMTPFLSQFEESLNTKLESSDHEKSVGSTTCLP